MSEPGRGPSDLSSCALEPVHLIGTVQSHGALMIFDSESEQLLEASLNWRELLQPAQPRYTRGATCATFFAPELVQALRQIETSERNVLLPHPLSGGTELSAHKVNGHLLVELENTTQARPFDAVGGLNSLMRGVSAAHGSGDFLNVLAAELRKSIDIDRVMIYRFLPDWTGEVVAEASAGKVEYLGLRFPSTDIPDPARRIFQKVWVRHIADTEAPVFPVPAGSGDGSTLSAFDLTQVGIRAASPIHLEYLRNMGVQASLTLSLRLTDRLWGLVACHHQAPFLLKPSARASLEILAQLASFQLSRLLEAETREAREATEARLSRLEGELERTDDARLSGQLAELEGFIDSDSIAIYEDGRWTRRSGIDLQNLEAFLLWFSEQGGDGVSIFHRADIPVGLVPGYAGVLVAVPTTGLSRLVCWFRREQAQSVRWAGNPDKAGRASPAGRLHPRASFAEYVEIAKGKALPWTEIDLWKAQRFTQVVRAVSFRTHQRLQLKNEALSRSNRELDSFAYMAAHDLKEPLRGIRNYAVFLREDYAETLQGEGLMFLDGLCGLVERMSTLVDSLLAYSRLDNQNISITACDLRALAEETCSLLKITRNANFEVVEPLPVVQAYPPFLAEILVNLLTNAVKYSDEAVRRVQIGALAEGTGFDTFYVKDNGIGIAPEFHNEIFHLFRRLHGEGEGRDGTGVGLTIVKKMVERQGGRVWVDSAPEKGSTFYVSLPKHPPSERAAIGGDPAPPA